MFAGDVDSAGIEADRASIHWSALLAAVLWFDPIFPFVHRIEQRIERRRFRRRLDSACHPFP
jgi:hypothetical protein